MKNWKIIIEHMNKTLELIIEAKTYSEAYIKVGVEYPDCIVKSVSEIKKK